MNLLKAFLITLLFVIVLSGIFDYLNWDLDFLVGWWGCLVFEVTRKWDLDECN